MTFSRLLRWLQVACGALLLGFAPPLVHAATLAIVHAKAWTMTADTPIEDATIVMRDGRIIDVAARRAPPPDAEVIDAGGRPVTPALFGALTTVGLVGLSAADDTDDRSIASGALGAAFDVRYALNPNDLVVEEARAAGMTRALAAPAGSASPPFSGVAALVRLAPDTGSLLEHGGVAVVARIGGAASGADGSRAAQWVLLRNALDEARRYGALRRPGAPRDALLQRPDAEALLPVLQGERSLLLEVHRESDIRQAIALARDFGLRLVIAGASEAWRVAPELAAAGIGVILDPLADLPMSYDEMGARPDNAALLAAAGVRIAFSVVAQGIYLAYSPAQSLREGAGLAVANGLPYVRALAAITRDAAALWGMDARTGTIAPGKDADVVIWDGDPIEPSSAPYRVFVGGRAIALTTRQTRLRDRYDPRRAAEPWPESYRP